MKPKGLFLDEALNRRHKNDRFRELTAFKPQGEVTVSDESQSYINFCGNDYLGLSKHPAVIEKSAQYVNKYGAGSTASRLVCGTYTIHEKLEKKLADTFGWESALLFNSGYQANSTIISSLADRHSLILTDKLSHNSLLQGVLSSRAEFQRFEHNSVDSLDSLLQKAAGQNYRRIFVITESLFSMDGDRSDLKAIAKCTQKHNAWLFVDDAHAVGVWGEKGLGLAHGIPGIDMVLGTCGKAFGSFGAFLLCSSRMKQYLINFCSGFIYTTAPPPAVVGAIDAALSLIPKMQDERNHLYGMIKKMTEGIHEAGYPTGSSSSQIIPIMMKKDKQALMLAGHLKKQGFLATAIRPPTVPNGSARIRIALSSAHTLFHIKNFLTSLKVFSND